MKEIIDILGTTFVIILILVLGAFSIVSCFLTSGMDKYEGYERNSKDERIKGSDSNGNNNQM